MLALQFRPAQATDSEMAVELIYSSGSRAFDYAFNRDNIQARDFLAFVFKNGRGFFGWCNHTVIILNHTVVGIGATYSGEDYLRLSSELTWQVAQFYPATQMPQVWWRLLQLQTLMPKPSYKQHYLANFAVNPNMRSQKIGTAFLEYQQTLAKQLGREIYALDVATDNPRAQALYERYGFQVIKTQRFKGKKGCVADTRRMEMRLR